MVTMDPMYAAAAGGGIILLFILWYFKSNNKKEDDNQKIYDSFKIATPQPIVQQVDKSFISKMKNTGKNVVVFYGSQTGTADDFANRLAKECARYGMKGMAVDLEEIDPDDLHKLKDIHSSLAIFCMATYGEGDPTDNAHEFYEWLKEDSSQLEGVRYVVFGLGNKTYKHYNEVGKFVDKRLAELGSVRLFECGLGDDDGNIEEDFITWKEQMWSEVCTKLGFSKEAHDVNMRQYALKTYEGDEVPPEEKIFKGEISRLGSYKNQKPVFDQKNPFLAKVKVNRELHKGGDRSCIHTELDITGSRLRYDSGDHVAVYPVNNTQLVEGLAQRLNFNLDQVISLNTLDPDSNKKHPFPCPCTYRTALIHYVDITSPLKTNVLSELAQYASDDNDKERLKLMSSSTTEGKEEYMKWIVNARRHILAVLEDLPSLKPPIDLLCEMLPRLQMRYYSISSSPKLHPQCVHITAAVVNYTTTTNRQMKGVATGYLSGLQPSEESVVPVFIRRSMFKLPFKINSPIIMVGPGTGLAPFRGFLQERDLARQEGKPIGETILYTGFRKSAEDFLYADELQEYEKNGTLKKLYIAFSRDQPHKIYVQNLMNQEENRKELWRLLENGAYFYICGDAKNMARDVLKTLEDILCSEGQMSKERAQDYMKQLQNKGRYAADVWS